VVAGDHHQLIHKRLLPCCTQAPVALVGRPHGGPPALRIRAGRSHLALLDRPPCRTGHGGNRSVDATVYAVNRFKDAMRRPGDMIHVDIKQVARFERVGHRITGDRRQGSSRGAGYEKVHVAIDDATRLGYVEVLADEQRATTVGFLTRAVGWFSEQGITCRRILSDNSPAYRSGDWRKACRALDLRPIRIKPYTPQTNGKAERFIKTLPSWRNGPTSWRTRPQRNGTAGYLGIWGSITATGATWLSVASPLSSPCSGC